MRDNLRLLPCLEFYVKQGSKRGDNMKSTKPNFSIKLIAIAIASSLSMTVYSAEEEKKKEDEEAQVVRVIGSHIKRIKDNDALPVTNLTEDDIEDTGAVTGDELLRNIPQLGEVAFNNERAIGGVNDARGDVNSINLRGLGTGNTLTLLNGRRLVLHPGTQSENFVPVTTVNANTLPVAGLRSLQVLRDGAAAIYGSDAVAGVINYALKDDYEGARFSLNYGLSEGTSLNQTNFNFLQGLPFNDGASHLTWSFNYFKRDGMMASERPYSRSDDRREYPGLPDAFVGDTQLDNRSTSTPWGDFIGASLGRFHIQPDTMPGCVQDLGNGICADRGGFPRGLRLDRALYRSMTSDVDRKNLYGYFTHEMDSGLEFFAEAFYYDAESERIREQTGNLTAQRFTIAETAAHNPFGQEVTVRSYRPVDAGNRNIEVDDSAYRLLGGFRGYFGDNWDWESAILHSEAKTKDLARNRVRASAFQAAINNTDPSQAYNPFNGANIDDVNGFDTTPNPQSVINPFLVDVTRDSKTSLSLIDFKLTNNALWELAAGDVGAAFGVEYRRESFEDDRDSLLDGSTPFVDQITGETLSGSDVLGSSPTPDSDGSRNVFSAYAELLIPLTETIEAQVAVRYEDFNDVGSATKPKLALFWEATDWMSLRASYAGGFRAPGLPQIHSDGVARSNNRYDPVVDDSYGILEIRSGSQTLVPEDDTNKAYGIVLEPIQDLIITVDWWDIEQENLVGILPSQTHLLYDSLLRSQGSSNPAVIRDPVDNEVVQINNQFMNLDIRNMSGVDFSIAYDWETTFGDFGVSLHSAKLNEFQQDADPISAMVIAAQEAGNPATPQSITVPGAGDLIKQNGRPEWRRRANIKWRHDNVGAGLAYRYVSNFFDTSVTTSEGDLLPIDSYYTIDMYADYRFVGDNFMKGSKLRFGVKNMADREPPIADQSFGYYSSVHSNRGRYFYLTLSKTL